MKQEKIFIHQTLTEYRSDTRIVITPPPRKGQTERTASIHDPGTIFEKVPDHLKGSYPLITATPPDRIYHNVVEQGMRDCGNR